MHRSGFGHARICVLLAPLVPRRLRGSAGGGSQVQFSSKSMARLIEASAQAEKQGLKDQQELLKLLQVRVRWCWGRMRCGGVVSAA